MYFAITVVPELPALAEGASLKAITPCGTMGILEDLLAQPIDRKAFSTALTSGVAISWQQDETKRPALVYDYLCRPDDYKAHGIDLDRWRPVIRRREDLSGIRQRINEAGWLPGEQRPCDRATNGSATYERLRRAGWV